MLGISTGVELLSTLKFHQDLFIYRINEEKGARGHWILFRQKALNILKMERNLGNTEKKETMLFRQVKPQNCLPVWLGQRR